MKPLDLKNSLRTAKTDVILASNTFTQFQT